MIGSRGGRRAPERVEWHREGSDHSAGLVGRRVDRDDPRSGAEFLELEPVSLAFSGGERDVDGADLAGDVVGGSGQLVESLKVYDPGSCWPVRARCVCPAEVDPDPRAVPRAPLVRCALVRVCPASLTVIRSASGRARPLTACAPEVAGAGRHVDPAWVNAVRDARGSAP